MVAITEVSAGLASLNAIKTIAQGISGKMDAVKALEIKSELLGLVIDAQEASFALQEQKAAFTKRIEQLEEEVAQLESWTAEAEGYELRDTGMGSLAYHTKDEENPTRPPHWICPHCYEDRKKSILHPYHEKVGREEFLICHPCGFRIKTVGYGSVSPSISLTRS
jgi:hypothetical protein